MTPSSWQRRLEPGIIGLNGEKSAVFDWNSGQCSEGAEESAWQKVLVIGGGNAAVDVAITSLRLGARGHDGVSRMQRRDARTPVGD